MHVDLGAFSYLDGERSDGTGTPGLFIVDGKTEALIERDESFGVRRRHGNVVNTHGGHLFLLLAPAIVTVVHCTLQLRPTTFAMVLQYRIIGNRQRAATTSRSLKPLTTRVLAARAKLSGVRQSSRASCT